MTGVAAGLSRAEGKVPFHRKKTNSPRHSRRQTGGKEQPALLAQSGLFATAV